MLITPEPSSIIIAWAPHTHGLPMPRATTAACDVLPPWLVRMPRAAIIPGRSSGVVSLRTSTVGPVAATAASLLSTIAPTAAPGDAGTPVTITGSSPDGANAGNMSWDSWAPVTRAQGLVEVDEALVDELAGDDERGGRRALAHPGLQHPELAALDGELDVAQVAVVLLERAQVVPQLVEAVLVAPFEVGQGQGVVPAGDDVLALGVRQVVAVGAASAGGGVAAEGDAGAGVGAQVPVDHRHHGDGGAEIGRDAFLPAVRHGAGRAPRGEDRADGGQELLPRVLGEVLPRLLAEHVLHGADDTLELRRPDLLGARSGCRAAEAASNRSPGIPATVRPYIWIRRR